MNTSDLIQPRHREAVRQHLRPAVESAPSGLEPGESLRLQYALRQRASELGVA